jgi:hypothetical protein
MTLTTINLAALGQTVNLGTEVTGTLPTGNGGTGSTATTFVNAATNVTGALPIANGGTALTSGFVNGGGLTEADQWRITTSWNGSANPITSNWERNDTDFDKIGTGMTQSSGNFTFASTGIYKVEFNLPFSKGSGDTQYAASKINVTTDNSTYNLRATSYGFINEAGGETYSGVYCSAIVDVTNTSNVKVQFGVVNQSATDFYGDTSNNKTTATFIRLGDT